MIQYKERIKEIWRPIQGYEGLYEVSPLGHVRSLDRKQIDGRSRKGKLLKQAYDGCGYPRVRLYNNGNKAYSIHRLVAMAFIPNHQNKQEVNHKDGNKQNNIVENLEWCTHAENIRHSFNVNLRNHKGENNTASKATEKQVLKIREMYQNGDYKQSQLANIYGFSTSIISRIISRKTWKHV